MTKGRPPGLPDFRKPPLVEVALSVQFEPLPGLTTAHVGLLWQSNYRQQLPLIEEHPPLESAKEDFGPPAPQGVSIAFGNKPPAPRVWFLNEEKTELLQIQPDRFVHNWRKTGAQDHYPRYETIRDQFKREVRALVGFLNEQRLDGLSINQCEVTYVNHVDLDEPEFSRVEKLVANWQPLRKSSFLPVPEDLSLSWRFRMPDEAGRLHVFVQPAWDSSGKRLWAFRLMARGRPTGEGLEGAFGFLDVGREWVVRGFADLTTGLMHRLWERTDA